MNQSWRACCLYRLESVRGTARTQWRNETPRGKGGTGEEAEGEWGSSEYWWQRWLPTGGCWEGGGGGVADEKPPESTRLSASFYRMQLPSNNECSLTIPANIHFRHLNHSRYPFSPFLVLFVIIYSPIVRRLCRYDFDISTSFTASTKNIVTLICRFLKKVL